MAFTIYKVQLREPKPFMKREDTNNVETYLPILKRHQLIEAEWHIYTSVNYTVIGSDNGLLLSKTE